MPLDFKFFLEVFGYIGTALVIISMLMTSVVKLRILNICGSVISMIYAIIGQAWPIVLLNGSLVLINIIQLIRMNRVKITFSRVTTTLSDKSVEHFLSLYDEDIKKYFPEYTLSDGKNYEVHTAYIGSEAVGMIIAERHYGDMHIKLDYATPKYRDLSVSTFLFSKLEEDGVERLLTDAGVSEHKKYLIRMGFYEDGDQMVKVRNKKENNI